MKNPFLVLLFSLFFFNSFAQIKFEKGYFININNEKKEVLIKNIEWKNTPDKIQYKTSIDGDSRTLDLTEINELVIYDKVKFVRKEAEIDRSSSELKNMSTSRLPDFKLESILLKVLIDGEATLYAYTDANLRRYFFKKNNQDIKQLVYKKYNAFDRGLSENNQFKQQLLNELPFSGSTVGVITNIEYNQSDLVSYFIDFNNSLDKDIINYTENETKGDFNLSIKAGLRTSNFSVEDQRQGQGQVSQFDSATGFSLGLEMEYVFKFNGGKWSVFFEPRYQSVSLEGERIIFAGTSIESTENFMTDYSSIELNFGFRHYFFLNENSKLYVNGAFVFDSVSSDNVVKYEPGDSFQMGSGDTFQMDSSVNFALGFGYKFDNKYSAEFLFQTNRNPLEKITAVESKTGSLSLIFGYTIF
jgi:hypothetical protein